MQTVPHDEIINVPPEIAVCPYCGGKLTVQLDTWVQLDDGAWGVGETAHVECESEPDIPEDDDDMNAWDESDEWDESHSAMPYVYLLPVEIKVAKWINANYRFDMETNRG